MITPFTLLDHLNSHGVPTADLERHKDWLVTIADNAPRLPDAISLNGIQFGMTYAEGNRSVKFTFSRISGAAHVHGTGEGNDVYERATQANIISCFSWVFAELLDEAEKTRDTVIEVRDAARRSKLRAEGHLDTCELMLSESGDEDACDCLAILNKHAQGIAFTVSEDPVL